MSQGRFVDSDRALKQACREMRACNALGFDTEFVRTRTYYSILGLIQVSAADTFFLIDPIAIEDLSPLARIFENGDILKIFYSCSEDLEVLYQRCNVIPTPIFDCQIAAAFVGHPFAGGYQGLVAAMMEVQLSKHSTRTDWTKRPLSEEQLEYAVEDVEYLIPLCNMLTEKLRKKRRLKWVEDLCGELTDSARLTPDPSQFYKRLKQSPSLPIRELAMLQRLCAWRENEAMQRDWPRNFVVSDAVLVSMCRLQPSSKAQLSRISGLHPVEVRRNSKCILDIISDCQALPVRELPESMRHRRSTPAFTANLRRLRDEVNLQAEALDIPTDLIAPRRALEDLLASAVKTGEPTLPRELSGWRLDVVGKRLLELTTEIAQARARSKKPEVSSEK
jgi:ribonuclease D